MSKNVEFARYWEITKNVEFARYQEMSKNDELSRRLDKYQALWRNAKNCWIGSKSLRPKMAGVCHKDTVGMILATVATLLFCAILTSMINKNQHM